MIRTFGILLLLVVTMTLSGCHGTRQIPEHERPAPVLLISIDGFRHDYFDLADTPALDRLLDGGLKADSLQHVFPTKTFPTHYSLATGCHPGTHGVVANNMWDPERDALFSLGDRDAVGDGYWYDGCEPIWVTAESQGLIAGTYFWPGTEARIRGVRPTHWKPYAGETPHGDRVETLLSWLDLPPDQRPDLLTLYFSVVDSAGHRHGPRADAVREAVLDVDRNLGILFDGLQQRGLFDKMHIILVSDHGMSRVDFDQYIMLDDYLDLRRVRVSDWGPAAQIWASDMPAEDIVAALDGAHPHLRVWAREDIPQRYYFGSHRRVPDVLAEADLEWMISNKPHRVGRQFFSLYGMHGWDPAHLEMHGAFVIRGPGIASGQSPAVRSVDVYDLMAHLLKLEPADNDGSLAPFQPYLDGSSEAVVEEQIYDCRADILRARLGPAHMTLHFLDQAHVLDRVAGEDSGLREYAATGLFFSTDGTTARAEIDGRIIHGCRPMLANR